MILTIHGTPVQWPKKQIAFYGKGGIPLDRPKNCMYDPKGRFRAYRDSLAIQIGQQYHLDLIKPPVALAMGAMFYVPQPPSVKREFMTVKPDLDNYLYAITNLLKGLVYADDNQIVQILPSAKIYTTQPEGHAVICIQKVTGTTDELISEVRKYWGEF